MTRDIPVTTCLYNSIEDCWERVRRHLGHLMRYSDAHTDQQRNAIRLEALLCHDEVLRNKALDDDCISPPYQQRSEKVQQNNRCTPPTLLCKASERLGPICITTYIPVQRTGTEIDGHNTI